MTLNEFFKDVYMSDDPLDEDHSLTYYMDFKNSMCYDNKMMNTYKVTLRKYGLTHGGSFECSWGHPSTIIMHEEELQEKEKSSDYEIICKKLLSKNWYSKITGKITQDGVFHPTKNRHYWSKGKRKQIELPLSCKLLK